MKFFEGVRPSVYLQSARLRLEKKTSFRMWTLTLAITMNSKLAHACEESIVSNFAQIATEENRCSGIDIGEDPDVQRVSVFALEDDKQPVFTLSHWTVSGLRLVKTEGLVELWATIEHLNTDALHAFVKDYAFKRVWLEFVPNQQAPDGSQPAEPSVEGEVPGEVKDLHELLIDRMMDAAEGKGDPKVIAAMDRLAKRGLVEIKNGNRTVSIAVRPSKAKAKANADSLRE
jgi:hypothetical protein